MNGAAWAVVVVVAIVAILYGRARLFPWRRCRKCKGTRRVPGLGGFRICTRCDKEGKVRRIGAGKES